MCTGPGLFEFLDNSNNAVPYNPSLTMAQSGNFSFTDILRELWKVPEKENKKAIKRVIQSGIKKYCIKNNWNYCFEKKDMLRVI